MDNQKLLKLLDREDKEVMKNLIIDLCQFDNKNYTRVLALLLKK